MEPNFQEKVCNSFEGWLEKKFKRRPNNFMADIKYAEICFQINTVQLEAGFEPLLLRIVFAALDQIAITTMPPKPQDNTVHTLSGKKLKLKPHVFKSCITKGDVDLAVFQGKSILLQSCLPFNLHPINVFIVTSCSRDKTLRTRHRVKKAKKTL